MWCLSCFTTNLIGFSLFSNPAKNTFSLPERYWERYVHCQLRTSQDTVVQPALCFSNPPLSHPALPDHAINSKNIWSRHFHLLAFILSTVLQFLCSHGHKHHKKTHTRITRYLSSIMLEFHSDTYWPRVESLKHERETQQEQDTGRLF